MFGEEKAVKHHKREKKSRKRMPRKVRLLVKEKGVGYKPRGILTREQKDKIGAVSLGKGHIGAQTLRSQTFTHAYS